MRGRRAHGDTLPRARAHPNRRGSNRSPDANSPAPHALPSTHHDRPADFDRRAALPYLTAGANRDPHPHSAATAAVPHTHRKNADFHRNPALFHPPTGPNRDPYRPASDHRRRWI